MDVGMNLPCMVYVIISLLIYDCWSVSACNSLGSLGETSRAALQWSGRNSMVLLVGVHGGAPSV